MAWRARLPAICIAPRVRGEGIVLRRRRQFSESSSRSGPSGKSAGPDSRVANGAAEIGLAFDGDGDRLGVVTKDGQIIYPDRQLMLFAEDVLSRNPGQKIFYDVKCTRHLAPWIDRTRRCAVDVEDRPFAGQGADARNRCAARRRDERPCVFQGSLVRFRRWAVRWRASAGIVEPGQRSVRSAECIAAIVRTPELQLQLAEGENFALIDKLQREARSPAIRSLPSGRLARRISGWLWLGALFQYHAGGGDAV